MLVGEKALMPEPMLWFMGVVSSIATAGAARAAACRVGLATLIAVPPIPQPPVTGPSTLDMLTIDASPAWKLVTFASIIGLRFPMAVIGVTA